MEISVVQDILFLKRVQVPVDVVGQHNGCLLSQRQRGQSSRQLRETLRVLSRTTRFHTECSMSDDISWEILQFLVKQREGNGRFRMRRDGPIALVIAHIAPVESRQAAVFICGHFQFLPAQSKRAVFDAIGVPAHDSPEVRMIGFCILQVVARVVIAYHYILFIAISIRHEHRRQSRTVGDQGCSDILRANLVGLKGVAHRIAASRGRCGRRCSDRALRLSQHGQSVQDGGKIGADVHSETKAHGDRNKDAAVQEQETRGESRGTEQPGNARFKKGRE